MFEFPIQAAHNHNGAAGTPNKRTFIYVPICRFEDCTQCQLWHSLTIGRAHHSKVGEVFIQMLSFSMTEAWKCVNCLCVSFGPVFSFLICWYHRNSYPEDYKNRRTVFSRQRVVSDQGQGSRKALAIKPALIASCPRIFTDLGFLENASIPRETMHQMSLLRHHPVQVVMQ